MHRRAIEIKLNNYWSLMLNICSIKVRPHLLKWVIHLLSKQHIETYKRHTTTITKSEITKATPFYTCSWNSKIRGGFPPLPTEKNRYNIWHCVIHSRWLINKDYSVMTRWIWIPSWSAQHRYNKRERLQTKDHACTINLDIQHVEL